MLSVLFIASLCSLAIARLLSLHSPNSLSNAIVEHPHSQRSYHYSHSPPHHDSDSHLDDLELLDIVLLASVDGKLHALNRTSGQTLWSMAPSPDTTQSTSTSGPTALSPLVRTNHIDYDPEITDDSTQQAVYIIEPQSGDIYFMPNPSSPLQRFPFTMQELVDMSPFSFRGEDDSRVFVGKKETSLLVVELQTGKIKATLNSECPWDQFEDFKEREGELDLDELEDSVPPKAPPAEVYIGRTDYHVSIISTRSNNRDSSYTRQPIQNLSFSTYGPNKQDNHIQSLYRRTKDNAYIQSLPNGEIISFKAKSSVDSVATTPNQHLLWGRQAFNQPVVAVFDVLNRKPSSKRDSSSHPFVLLQPRPKIQDLLPNLSPSTKESPLSAYIGLIEETGSLFALTPNRYPLVAFGRQQNKYHRRLIDGNGVVDEDEDEERGTSVDEMTRLRKLREAEAAMGMEEIQCHETVMNDRRCLVGIHRLEMDTSNGQETRMKRLLDASPSSSYEEEYSAGSYSPPSSNSNESNNPPPLTIDPPVTSVTAVHTGIASAFRMWEVVSATLVLGLVIFWVLNRKDAWEKVIKGGLKTPSRSVVEPVTKKVSEVEDNVSAPSPKEATAVTEDEQRTVSSSPAAPVPTPLPLTPQPSTSPPTPSTATTVVPPPPSAGDETDKEDLDGAQTEGENDDFIVIDPASGGNTNGGSGRGATVTSDATPKKKTRRGKRGAKKPKNGNGDPVPNSAKANVKVNGKEKEKDVDVEETQTPPSSLILTSAPKAVSTPGPSLVVSDVVLGYGSHGTVVYRGSLQGRAVAVKRLLADFVTLASREVSILQESDDHPNVIRYYYQEAHAGFLYIALELCPASLADLVETPDRDAWRDIAVSFDPKRALRQVTNGLRHLHGLKLVHRDIKPQNILVSTKGGGNGNGNGGGGGTGSGTRGTNYRMLISDFGLCKKLDVDQTSFLPTAHGAMAAGTVGWRAPEILRGEVKLDDEMGDDQSSLSSRGSTTTVHGNSSIHSTSSNNSTNGGKGRTRLTKSVDIFALGCLYYYTLTGGGHPFGDRYEREVNIMKNAKNLELLERFGEEGTEAVNLIERMLDPLPSERPDTTSCLLHPFFWDSSRRLNFLQDASDRFEIMCRDPKDPNLLTLEEGAQAIVGNDWHSRLDRIFIENLGKFRKYDGRSVQDLLRALRNKKHHYQDLPDNVKRHLGPMPEGFLAYFTRRFPNLFLHVHRVIKETGLANESMFRNYFELPDS